MFARTLPFARRDLQSLRLLLQTFKELLIYCYLKPYIIHFSSSPPLTPSLSHSFYSFPLLSFFSSISLYFLLYHSFHFIFFPSSISPRLFGSAKVNHFLLLTKSFFKKSTKCFKKIVSKRKELSWIIYLIKRYQVKFW